MTQLPLSIFFLLLVSASCESLEWQRSTLLSMKQEWGNPASLSSWNAGTSPCSWQQITCSSDAVTGISLSESSITTPIPASICDFKNLTYLDLSNNYIPGEFPTQLYNCSSLAYLDLSNNNFVGRLPDDLNKLAPSSLHHLDLSYNNFTGDLPDSIAGLHQLRSFYMLYNLLNGTFPSEIANLSNLQDLRLAYNSFTPMPLHPEWGNMKQLQYLFMRECYLVGEIPQTFGGLESLQHLDLVGNEIVGEIPSALFLLKDLSYVYLYKNKLSGEIPSTVHSLNLTEIDLSHNSLTGPIPQDFGKLKQVRILNLFENKLDGEIPANIGLLPELQIFRVFNNSLSGLLPPELGLHSPLQALEIGTNHFSGPIPQNLCSNRAFIGLTAFSNNLIGEIPKSLANCTALRNLMLQNNNLTGVIPSGLWSLPNVYLYQFSFNGFTGQLPDRIPWNLTWLELDNNKLSGNIPAGVSTWKNIQLLNAGNNLLTGTIPLGLTSLSNLYSLTLEGNQLTGSLPTKISSWKSLSILRLGGNRLSGSIPRAIGTLSNLNYIDLSSNDLSGAIPLELGKLHLSFLNLSNNELTGEIPESVENQAYPSSFLNNTGLCTSDETSIQSLPRCSEASVNTKSNKHISSKYLALILVLAVLILLIALYLSLLVVNEMRQRNGGSNVTKVWKLTSFQRLEFTENSIVSSLCEENVIGRGGSGKVYRVPISSGKVVAVKKIWSNEIDESQFLAEVQILSTIRHSNVVKLLCCVCSDDTKLLVYEHLANQSLDRWLHGRSFSGNEVLDWSKRMKIAIGAAQGLCYMHHESSPPVVHRDVKSSNILLDSDFNPKIGDFGLAKITGKLLPSARVPQVAGSLGYMAPEYRETKKVVSEEGADVYSFGVVLLELVTGKEASGDGRLNLAESSWKHYKEGREVEEAVDEELKQPIGVRHMAGNVFKLGLMCTSVSPSSRPSMKEVLQMLRRFNLDESHTNDDQEPKTVRDVAPLLPPAAYKSRSKRGPQQHNDDDDHSAMV